MQLTFLTVSFISNHPIKMPIHFFNSVAPFFSKGLLFLRWGYGVRVLWEMQAPKIFDLGNGFGLGEELSMVRAACFV
ncbi:MULTISPECIES: hypothetical protein [Leptospira]|uniref:Uncharacterized protein n=3 Tax=Leptospira borgpetersenii TaxID=174 RepID=M3FHQ2_LEPBO|nr:hypothetical protein [Leptospira borgpetersenii]EMG01358.1 hypothetical protein LEP1GSC123_3864 [Leptospira borgpetersenii str. 200701203]EMK11509.1 hypothetical protein LEP1GSC066_1712 [Leptospira sp. serovar Kenya str. Sh9]EMN13836.1 hypothetical protein LEP1GSC055_1341 [Leptospira borgpetersenii str. Brem 307]EMN18189.1 hypothetical protein LEP1GSC056_1685 [Leptospira borgpetersenii str. Brem 328]EKP13518.1 hypothetical protein LEP1GSC128_4227 [Leptospira borgpetersenii str. 200801926]